MDLEIIHLLVEFFLDSYETNPADVSDWIESNVSGNPYTTLAGIKALADELDP